MTTLTFPIQKREMFDEDNMKYLTNDDRFNKQDLSRLKMYNKHRVCGSTINVSYKLGLGCEENQLGRLFPDDGMGLQSFRFDLRNPLAKKFYWDTDVENAHYIIAQKFCQDYGLKCEHLDHYINNREECLKMVSNSRKKAKTEFLKTLYLGNIHLYREDFKEQDGDISIGGLKFLHNLQIEVERLAENVWAKFPQYHKLKTGQEKKMIIKKPNPKASLMSLIFQTEERKILLAWDAYLIRNKRYMGVYIHDGGYVEKLEGETRFPEDLLIGGSEHILETLGYKARLTQKNIEYEWSPKKPQESQYQVRKREFELSNFLVGADFCSIHSDGVMAFMKERDMKVKFANWIISYEEDEKIVKKPFLKMWMEDPDRLYYEKIDFIPDIEKCPKTTYNLFTGFNAEKYKPEIEMTVDEILAYVQPIRDHLNLLTTGNEEFMCKWFANIIQNPSKKSEVAPVIRDQDELTTNGGGTGKNLQFEWFGEHILGEKYVQIVGNNSELFGNFNSMYEGKLLIFVEEASGKDNHSNNDNLKSQITQKKRNVNKKNQAQYTVNDYARYVFTSNNRNPLKPNRRFAIFDTNPEKKGDVKYFEDLSHIFSKSEVKWAFYMYLKTLETYQNPIQFEKNIPITSAYIEIRMLNAPLYHKWLISLLRKGRLENGNTTDLYKQFVKWVGDNREHSTNIMTQTEFGLLLANAKEASEGYEIGQEIGNKTKRHGVMVMMWNIGGLVGSLQRMHLLENEFIYSHINVQKIEDENYDIIEV